MTIKKRTMKKDRRSRKLSAAESLLASILKELNSINK